MRKIGALHWCRLSQMTKVSVVACFIQFCVLLLHKGDTADPYEKSGQKWIHRPQTPRKTDTIHKITTMLATSKNVLFL